MAKILKAIDPSLYNELMAARAERHQNSVQAAIRRHNDDDNATNDKNNETTTNTTEISASAATTGETSNVPGGPSSLEKPPTSDKSSHSEWIEMGNDITVSNSDDEDNEQTINKPTHKRTKQKRRIVRRPIKRAKPAVKKQRAKPKNRRLPQTQRNSKLALAKSKPKSRIRVFDRY